MKRFAFVFLTFLSVCGLQAQLNLPKFRAMAVSSNGYPVASTLSLEQLDALAALVIGGKIDSNALAAGQVISNGNFRGSTRIKAKGGTTDVALEDLLATRRDVRFFGAACDGTTDDTAAVAAAVAACGTNGGTVFIPGKCRFNLTNTASNIELLGEGGVMDFSGTPPPTAYWTPANTNAPLIQAGKDTGLVKGFRVRNATLWGNGAPSAGVYCAGGAFEATFQNIAIHNFLTNVLIRGGTSYPASLITFSRSFISPSLAANARGIYVRSDGGAGYTTAVYFTDMHLNAPTGTGAYALEADGCPVRLVNTYFDMQGGKGVKLSLSGSAPTPYLEGLGATFDTGTTNFTLLTVFADVPEPSFWLRGSFDMNGILTMPTLPPVLLESSMQVPNHSELLYPQVRGSLTFMDGNQPNWDDGRRIYSGSTNLYVENKRGDLNLVVPAGKQVNISINGVNVGLWSGTNLTVLGDVNAADLALTGPNGLSMTGPLALSNSGIVLTNNQAISWKSATGVLEPVLSQSTANNVSLFAPTEGGSVQIGTRGTSGTIQFLTGLNTRWQIDNAGTFYPSGTYDIAKSNAPAGNLWASGLSASAGRVLEHYATVSGTNIDLSLASGFIRNAASGETYAFTNLPGAGGLQTITVRISNTSGGTITPAFTGATFKQSISAIPGLKTGLYRFGVWGDGAILGEELGAF